MKIKYNEAERSVEIKDGLKSHYGALKFLFVLNVLSAVLNLYDVSTIEFRSLEVIWAVIGFISLIALYIIIFKRSTQEKIQMDDVEQIKERSIFGNKRFSIQLKNGKLRSLIRVRSRAEIDELKGILANYEPKIK